MGSTAKRASRRATTAAGEAPRTAARPRVVYTEAPVALATVLGPAVDPPGAWRVRLGAREVTVACDATVDPALLADAARTGARVVLDTADGRTTVVGVLVTARTLVVDRAGVLDAHVKRFAVSADDEATLKVPGAFVQLRPHEAETYATRVVVRARELARILGRMVKLN